MVAILDNPNPTIFKAKKETARDPSTALWVNSLDETLDEVQDQENESEREEIDSDEIYGTLRTV